MCRPISVFYSNLRQVSITIALFLGLSIVSFSPNSAHAATFTVNSTDDVDDSTCDSNHCSLREAIQAANAVAGNDTIIFADALAGATISPLAALPVITDTLIMDGTTLPGFACQSAMQVVLDGTGAGAVDGLTLAATAAGSVIRGLVINNFLDGRALEVFGDNNVIECNFIGTTITGTVIASNRTGIFVSESASNNRIGTNGDGVNDTDEGNLLAGNTSVAIAVDGDFALNNTQVLPSGNTIAGNFIGTDITGTTALPNGIGVVLNATNNNIIGTNGTGNGFDVSERNLIAGNGETGIFTSGDAFGGVPTNLSNGNVIAGNLIGVDVTGTVALPNGTVGSFNRAGIWLDFGTSHTVVGTNGDGIADLEERNIVGGNIGPGVLIEDANSVDNVIAGNFIGVDITGTVALPNGTTPATHAGIRLVNAQGTRIGTNADGTSDVLERNVISGNNGSGIFLLGSNPNPDPDILYGSDNTVIAGNFIGTDHTGASAIANVQEGIWITQNSSNNLIGTNADGVNDAAERNIISGNLRSGIEIRDGNAELNVVAGNYIGTDVAGASAVPNSLQGIVISFVADQNRVGTNGDGINDAAERNIISGNSNHGVALTFGAFDNIIAGNYIGSDASGAVALANGNRGVNFGSGARDNIIGGDTPEEGNFIIGNATDGIRVNTNGANPDVMNTLQYNSLGISPAGTVIPNGDNNIELNNATITLIANNRIYNAPSTGIFLSNAAASLGANSINNCVVDNTAGFSNGFTPTEIFENNWWGAADGPSGDGPGSGDSISANVDVDPFLTLAPLNCGNSLTITKNFAPSVAVVLDIVSAEFTLTAGPNINQLTNVSFRDTLPDSLEIADDPNNPGSAIVSVAPECGALMPAGSVSPGSMIIEFTGGTILPFETCTVTVGVTSFESGSYANPATAIDNFGSTETGPLVADFPTAVLTVNDPIPNPADSANIPTLNRWGLIILILFFISIRLWYAQLRW